MFFECLRSGIDKYDPVKLLGEGSFGKVFLMQERKSTELVCVKMINIKNFSNEKFDDTLIEVDLLRRLHHPNIVRYIDSFITKSEIYICMEYCDKGDLALIIKNAGKKLFSEAVILHWFVQLALGLHYMHNQKVLHRDIKTQNIFLVGTRRLVLGDLGISKELDNTSDFAQTCIGTPAYMSPEILQNKPYNNKSDVWALGCVLYEMTTLNQAFEGETMHELAAKIGRGRYPTINHKYSKSLRELIAQMLLVDSSQRPDLGQILRKPFTKKHTIDFFTDVTAPTIEGMGEGTMVVRAAAGAPVNEKVLHHDTTMLSLRKQLVVLNVIQPKKKDLKLRIDTTLGKVVLEERSTASKHASSIWLLLTSCVRDHPINTATDSSFDSEERSFLDNSKSP